jgi:hypothetical protein
MGESHDNKKEAASFFIGPVPANGVEEIIVNTCDTR